MSIAYRERNRTIRKTKNGAFPIEYDREEDGRWIAEIPKLPGVVVYGGTREEAFRNVVRLAAEVLRAPKARRMW